MAELKTTTLVPLDPEALEDEALVRAELSEPDHEEYALITDYLANELSPEDRLRVEERLRTDAEFRALAEPIMMIWNLPFPLDKEPDARDRAEAAAAAEKLRKRIEMHRQGIHTPTVQERHAKQRFWRKLIRGTIGMTVGGLLTAKLVMWLFPRVFPVPAPKMYLYMDAPARAERAARLPDATEVALGPGSHLRYSRWLTSVDNTINLNGEATFTVPPGRRDALVIAGAGVVVKATGGRFTVQAYDALPVAYVVVHEGRVQVQARTVYAGSAFELVKAGERVRVGPALRIMLVNDAPIASHQ